VIVDDAIIALIFFCAILVAAYLVVRWMRDESAAGKQRAPYYRAESQGRSHTQAVNRAGRRLRATRPDTPIDLFVTNKDGQREFVGKARFVTRSVCPHCHETYGPTDAFCQECGTPIPGRS
jgi:hypothetical protein